MKPYIITFLLLSAVIRGFSQSRTNEAFFGDDSLYYLNSNEDFLSSQVKTSPQVSVEAGTMIVGGRSSESYYYISPGVSFQPTPSFRLNTGVQYSTGMGIVNPIFFDRGFYIPQKTVSIYAEGEYRFNERLHISGAAYKQESLEEGSGFFSDFGSEIYMIGLQYKITKNLRIGAQVIFQDGNLYNPYNPAYRYIYPNGMNDYWGY